MSWREMWEEYCGFVAVIVPIVFAMATAAIIFVASISIVFAVARWGW